MNWKTCPLILLFFASLLGGCIDEIRTDSPDDVFLEIPAVPADPDTTEYASEPTDRPWVIEQRLDGHAHWTGWLDDDDGATMQFEWIPDDADGYLVFSGTFHHRDWVSGRDVGLDIGSVFIPNDFPSRDQRMFSLFGRDDGQFHMFAESFGSPGTLRAAVHWGEGEPILWRPTETGTSNQEVIELPLGASGASINTTYDMRNWTSVHFALPCILKANEPRPSETIEISLGTTWPDRVTKSGHSGENGAPNFISHLGFWNYGDNTLPFQLEYKGTTRQPLLLFSDAPWTSMLNPHEPLHMTSSSVFCSKLPLDGDGDDDDVEDW